MFHLQKDEMLIRGDDARHELHFSRQGNGSTFREGETSASDGNFTQNWVAAHCQGKPEPHPPERFASQAKPASH
jgi:hypothetical protein